VALFIKRVVVADDDPEDLAITAASLKEFGRLTVFTVATADELVRTAKAQKPEVVVLGGAGQAPFARSLAGALRADPETEKIPIILIGNASSLELSEVGNAIGAKGVVRKPIDVQLLPAKVKEIVGAKSGIGDVLFRGK
jgi:CheY-like chemotaxis protein